MKEISRKRKLPGIGMRILKSAIAVVLCIVVNRIRGNAGMVFYSQLAALWCIQMYRDNTWKNAIQRTIGTTIGVGYGLLYLLLYPFISSEMLLLFISIIIVLYTTVLLQQKNASYFSCVVFLSIVINHIDDVNPFLFAGNRFLDTMIGIAIGILVNNFHFSFRPDRNTLFVSGVDDILVDEKDQMTAFSKVELNRMIDDGMRFTIATMRTPASLMEPLKDIHLKYPIIVMDGAAIYDVKNCEYVMKYVISSKTAKELIEVIENSKLCYYTNVIIDDTLLIYYKDTKDEVNASLVKELKTSPYRNYVNRPFPGDETVVYFMLLDQADKIKQFYQSLIDMGYDKKLKIITYPSTKYDGYSYIKIYNKNASKENMLMYFKEHYEIENCMTFGTIEDKYDVMISKNSFNEMVRILRKKY